MNITNKLIVNLKDNLKGNRGGFVSICSANELVIRASIRESLEFDTILCIESTSNQVDQFGGYTGMKPEDFANFVYQIASEEGFEKDKIILGGDHLGPNAWQNENEMSAMSKAKELISSYVKAGYKKIHLDTSMFLADDLGDKDKPLDDLIVANRAVILCKIAEEIWKNTFKRDCELVYIIGTEVPIPGGIVNKDEKLKPTSVNELKKTLKIFEEIFKKNDLNDALNRVVGVVVQPGVEFGDDKIIEYNSDNAKDLVEFIEKENKLVFEAHSTDYQTRNAFLQLNRDHFCIQKVGPALTFALKESLFSLENIEKEIFKNNLSNFRNTLDEAMLKNNKYWLKYYSGDDMEKSFKRAFSFSDRSRYYLVEEKVKESIEVLFKNINSIKTIPLSLLSQYCPDEYKLIREKKIRF